MGKVFGLVSRVFSSCQDRIYPSMGKKKIVIEVVTRDAKIRAKVLQIVVGFHGVLSVSEENGKITVVGDGIDPVSITKRIRKKINGCARIVTVGDVEQEKKPPPPPATTTTPPPVVVQPPPWSYCYDTYHPCFL